MIKHKLCNAMLVVVLQAQAVPSTSGLSKKAQKRLQRREARNALAAATGVVGGKSLSPLEKAAVSTKVLDGSPCLSRRIATCVMAISFFEWMLYIAVLYSAAGHAVA